MTTSLNSLIPISLESLRRETGALLLRLEAGEPADTAVSFPRSVPAALGSIPTPAPGSSLLESVWR